MGQCHPGRAGSRSASSGGGTACYSRALSSPTSRRRLCTNPVVCRSGIPNSTFSVRQVWIAESLKRCWRPRVPLGGGSQIISGSNQIDSDPRCFNAALYEGQFLVLYFVGTQLLMIASYHAGFKQ